MLSVILHLDLDCFYAQVERERLKLPFDAAVAVLQWNSALAVSYPARKYGIKRGSNLEQIRQLSGDTVTVVSVETIGNNPQENVDQDINEDIQNESQSINSKSETNSLARFSKTQATEKVSLARYRNASSKVFAAIASVLNSLHEPVLERASIDEAFIDVSAEVERRMQQSNTIDLPEGTRIAANVLLSDDDVRLSHGAHIAAMVRNAVLEKCCYSMSAGISTNKMLAKLASAQNKPNMQTIVPMSAASSVLKDLPLRKLRGLGGKLGKVVESLGVSTAGEAATLTEERLKSVLKREKDVEFVYRCVRGLDDSKVVARGLTKSILAAKNFRGEKNLETVKERWLPLLAGELVERMNEDAKINQRQPKTLTVSFRVRWKDKNEMTSASRSVAMSPVANAGDDVRVQAIVKTALTVIQNAITNEKLFAFPINFIGLTATNFVEWASERENISNYFEKNNGDVTKNLLDHEEGKDLEQEHKRRLQESADRELALKLHREESTRQVKRERPAANSGAHGKATGKGSKKNKTTSTMTMDMFFGSAGKKLKR